MPPILFMAAVKPVCVAFSSLNLIMSCLVRVWAAASATKDERALKKWRDMQAHWDRFQKRMAVKLGRVRFSFASMMVIHMRLC